MKKKVKLITTFASLGLALALMVFGVYAAATVKYDITTSVSYSIGQNIAGSVAGKAYKNTEKATLASPTDPVTGTTANGSFSGNLADNVTYTMAFTDIELDRDHPYAIYEFTFTNASANKVTATMSVKTPAGSPWEAGIVTASATANANDGTATVVAYIQYVGDGSAAEAPYTTVEFSVELKYAE